MFTRTNKSWLKHFDFLLADIFVLISSFLLSNYIRHGIFFLNGDYRTLLFVIVLLEILIIIFYEPYKNILKRGYIKEFRLTLEFVAINLLAVSLYLFAIKEGSTYSRLVLAYTYGLDFVFSYLVRIILKRAILHSRKNLNNQRSLLIVSNKRNIKQNLDRIESLLTYTYSVKGICILDEDMKDKMIKEYPVVANKNDVLEYACRQWIDDVFFGVEMKKIPRELLEGLTTAGISTHIVFGDEYQISDRPQIIEKFGSYSVLSSFNRVYSNKQLVLKRLMDIVGGLVGCLITLVLTIIIGPIIYFKSPGPIFYSSVRIGMNGKRFKMYKFRSMIPQAEALKKDLMEHNRVKDGMMFKMEDDPRIIPGIGSFIRKTSLDEFPQFFNVLKGDMSLVGTRPPTVDEWEKYKPEHRMRMSTKPGITGLWQISGRNNIVDFDEVVKLDKQYIDNWDLGLDIKILYKTVFYLLSKHDDAM